VLKDVEIIIPVGRDIGESDGGRRVEASEDSRVPVEWGKRKRGDLKRRFVVSESEEDSGATERDQYGVGEEGVYCGQNGGD